MFYDRERALSKLDMDTVINVARTSLNLDIVGIVVYDNNQRVFTTVGSVETGNLVKDCGEGAPIHSNRQFRTNSPETNSLITRNSPKFKKANLSERTTPKLNVEQPKLSPRESEILTYLSKGLSYLEIAHLLEISPHTVTSTIKNIYRKLAVHSRGEAVYEGSRIGLIY